MRTFRLRTYALCLILAGCGHTASFQDDAFKEGDSASVKHSLIYIIHGDASYVYHDAEGNARNADEDKLMQARFVAENLPHGEVFIFHQRPESHFLIFPLRESRFLYYRNGEKVSQQRYFSRRPDSDMNAEAALYHRYRAENEAGKTNRILLYYGHEIPVINGHGYNRSNSEKAFNLERMAEGMKKINDEVGTPFDLTVLSTCNNGNPEVVSALASQTNYLIASPQDLHLSYMDSRSLTALQDQANLIMEDFAHVFARNAFHRLTSSLQTTVTISVFETRQPEAGLLSTFYREAAFGRRGE